MNEYSIKMRASNGGRHISGAEKIASERNVAKTVARLAERALAHAKGHPDFINLKIEEVRDAIHLKSLSVRVEATLSAEEGRARMIALLSGAGIKRASEIMALFPQTHAMRGAMLVDVDTLERLEPDRSRGVRATYMDDADSIARASSSGKNHYAEAIVLATKVQSAPGIVGEICVSDDPDYVTGYVATRELGYCRIMTVKGKGDPNGGRIFLYRGKREDVSKTIEYLERVPVIVDDVPGVGAVASERRFECLNDELESIRNAGLHRECRLMDSVTGPTTLVDGRELNVLSSNDYLDLAREKSVIEASVDAARRFGTGTGGSRLTTGTQQAHVELERRIASFKGAEDAIVYATGYMANVGTIQALVKKGDVVLSDALNHASIIDGCRLSGADVLVYRHNDMADLERMLSFTHEYRRRLVVSDAVFSMDGDILDLPNFIAICRRHDAFSMIDEAHSTGVIGKTGRGLCELFACGHPDVMLGTLSKALGSEGGYVCGSRALIDYLRNKARSFIFSTAPSAPSMASACAAIDFLEAHPERVAELQRKVDLFVKALRENGLDARTQSAIVPIPVGDENKAVELSRRLFESGFLIPAIRYPTVARGKAILRAVVMSSHDDAMLVNAAETISRIYVG